MQMGEHGSEAQEALDQVLGYLNFSSGAADPQFLSNLNHLYFLAASADSADGSVWPSVYGWLHSRASELQGEPGPFQNVDQALAVLDLLNGHVLSGYQEFHRDLLGHQSDRTLFNSFFVGRAAEAVLKAGAPWDESRRITETAISYLNDYIGHRPVATLESRKIEPYPHERVRPIPLFIAGAEVAVGIYHDVIRQCVALLQGTSEQLLREAYFDPSLLDELAMDPRAYDFDHPANKRPNYHFGQWDPHQIDNRGCYRRFVVQQVTLDALLKRLEEAAAGLPRDELLLEASAVLAGTILMSSGISGYGPDTHDSTTTLSSLLPRIASYRDAFYEQLLERIGGTHGARLRQEATRLHQPFGAARQDLNRQLTVTRAKQLERVQLAKVFARMGYPQEAQQQIAGIDLPSARIMCGIDCLLSEAQGRIERLELSGTLSLLEQAYDFVRRGIDCGALVDPWNILGFDGHFSLFPALENSIRDHRVDELVERMEDMFHLDARLWSAAAASHDTELAAQTSERFQQLAQWWHQYAAHEVDSVDAQDSLHVYQASKNVAEVLQRWHAEGASAGDVGFWAPHVETFESARAYALVINTLLASHDDVAALGLLIHWLSQSDRVALEQGDDSFHQLALRWLVGMLRAATQATRDADRANSSWERIRKFFDYLEANAGEYWHVPSFEIGGIPALDEGQESLADEEDQEDEQDDLFSAAYENVVYRDSTDDGVDSSLFDFGEQSEDQLQLTSHEILNRLAFLDGLALMWKLTAVAWCAESARWLPKSASEIPGGSAIGDLLADAARQIARFRRDLTELLESVTRYQLNLPSGDPESMVQYDRFRLIKESLLEQIVNAQVRMDEADHFVRAASEPSADAAGASDEPMVVVLAAAMRGNTKLVRHHWPKARDALAGEPILYVPLSRGGQAKLIVRAKSRQQILKNMLYWLPRLGMLREAYELLELARKMERVSPVGLGAVTEFDDLFEVGCRALVTALVHAQQADPVDTGTEPHLISCLEEMMEPLLRSWLAHSRTLRLSVLEQVADDEEWEELVEFIQQHGADLFTQRFLNLGNVRGILHQGVAKWLAGLEEDQADDAYAALAEATSDESERDAAADKLTLILEAIVESYAEYRDYNSTTTQSDRGDLLYMLLDFLRLRTSYDRVVWNLRPIVLAHQVLVRYRCEDAATAWRRSLRERIADEAQRHVRRLAALQKKHAMRLPSVSERLNERFMRPLIVDRLCASIEPAMQSADQDVRRQAFAVIQQEVAELVKEPSGAGLDVPGWLLAMEDEVHRVQDEGETSLEAVVLELATPPWTLSFDEIQSQIEGWKSRKGKSKKRK